MIELFLEDKLLMVMVQFDFELFKIIGKCVSQEIMESEHKFW
jgi:hypothetical protein